MYDASQGSTYGAHIDVSTAAGTNVYVGHGRTVAGFIEVYQAADDRLDVVDKRHGM